MARRLTLVAGSGSLAPLVAAAAQRGGDPLQVIDIVGRGDIGADAVLLIPVARAEDIVAAIRAFRTTHLVLAGGVHLSDADREVLALAHGVGPWVTRTFGDVGLALTGLLFYSLHGVKLLGADRIIPELVAPDGMIAGSPLDAAAREGARRALHLARRVGDMDLGQAVVISAGRPIAAEDAGGTDALLARVAALKASGLVGNGAGPLILAKAKKRRQPRFVDLPTIGPQTIASAAAAGIGIIVVEAGASLVLEREAVQRDAAASGVSVLGLR